MSFGSIEQKPFESVALFGNRFGDPHLRPLTVYLPPGYADDPDRRYPVVYVLASHGNTGQAFLNWKPWAESLPQRLDRLMGGGLVAPALVVLPDTWTSLGSSQYLNSTIGAYEDYLIQEIIPHIDRTYRTRGDGFRAVLGHSSGGYGAIVQAMRHPDVFSVVACHAGDMYWEYTCLPGIAALHQGLQKYGGAAQFLADLASIEPKNGTFWKTVMTMCWALAHGSNPDAPLGFDLPIDPATGALDEAVWARWLRYDPVRMLDVAAHQTALRRMKAVYITAGLYDEYQLQVGARVFCQKLAHLGIPHLHEELPTGHSGADVPYDRSLELLVKSLLM